MRNGWIKHFRNGTVELGYDSYVAKKAASWSKGRLEHISGVTLHHNGTTIAIEGTGVFWQADVLETNLFSSNTIYVKRRIYKKICAYDVAFIVEDGIAKFSSFPISKGYKIEKTDEGKWFVFEIDCGYNRVNWRIEDNGPILG